MTTILDRIVASKRIEIEEAKVRVSASQLEKAVASLPPARDFRAALAAGPNIQVIAEVKKASPSAGEMATHFDPVATATIYEKHGAACISVLTDGPFFQGKLEDLQAVRKAVSIPLLRKDFILDRYQLLQARLAGADAALLIAEILDDHQLRSLQEEARQIGLQTLVELYEPENVNRVLDSGARLVGVNNRDLRSFVVRLEHTLDLARRMPPDVLLVSESGIRSPEDVQRLATGSVKAILVGETLMRAENPGKMLETLRSVPITSGR